MAQSVAKAKGDEIQGADLKRFKAMMLLDRAADGDVDGAKSGDIEAARQLLGEADAAYAELGMPRHQALTSELLAGL
jgi:hypothetical protein